MFSVASWHIRYGSKMKRLVEVATKAIDKLDPEIEPDETN